MITTAKFAKRTLSLHFARGENEAKTGPGTRTQISEPLQPAFVASWKGSTLKMLLSFTPTGKSTPQLLKVTVLSLRERVVGAVRRGGW